MRALRGSVRSPSLDGVFVLAHDATIDEELLVRLHRLWGEHARTVRGDPMPDEAVDLHARMLLRHPHELTLVLVPPLAATDAGGKAPPFALQLAGKPSAEYAAALGLDSLTVDLPVLRAQRLRYATLWAGRLDVASPSGTARFLDACRRVRDALQASFAFGASVAELSEPDLVDPRGRAWGVAYYGAALARGLPLDRLDARAEVERDDAGGAWVKLDPVPFVDDADKDARRREVEATLGLPARFGAGHPQA